MTTRLPFSKLQFQTHFFNENIAILCKISLNFLPNGPIDSSTGLDNGLVPNMQQVIIWTNDGLI